MTHRRYPSDYHLISEIETVDLDEIVALHIRSFPEFFLSKLGPKVLRVFYSEFVHCTDTVAVKATRGRDIVGVAVGPLHPEAFFRDLIRRRWMALGLGAMTFVLTHPTQGLRVIRAVRYRGSAADVPGALLSAICVDPSARCAGVGRRLLRTWEAAALQHGAKFAHLTTDEVENDEVIRFYKSVGWSIHSRYTTPERRSMLVLARTLSGNT